MLSFLVTFLAIFAILVGVSATAMMLVLLLAASPNSTPRQWRRMKAAMLLTAGAGVAGALLAILATLDGRPGVGALVGASPVAFHIILFLVLSAIEQRELPINDDPAWNTCRRVAEPRPRP